MSYFVNTNKCCFLPNSICYLLTILAFFLATSCHPVKVKDKLSKEWYVVGYKMPLTQESSSAPPTYVFRLYPNGSYTQLGRVGFTEGRWHFLEKQQLLLLTPASGSSEVLEAYLTVNFLGSNKLSSDLYRNLPLIKGHEETQFRFEGLTNKSDADPYTPRANEWRKQPKREETDLELKKRVKGYLLFLKTVFQHAIDNKTETIQTDWYPQPIRMFYSNGVRMAYSDELDDWNRCFYDSAQAVKGYQLISGPLMNVTLNHKESKFERNLDCVNQLIGQLK